MSARANPLWVGAFVLGAAVLAVASVLVLGSGRLLEVRVPFVLYFDEAVTGLTAGASVNFQGVQIGSVKSVSAVLGAEPGSVRVPVYIEILPGRVEVEGDRLGPVEVVEREVGRGLRARLKIQSILTSQLYIDLDYYPDKPASYKGYDSDADEIPTIPTELEELRNTLAPLVDEIRALPLEQMVRDLSSAMGAIDGLLNKPELAHAIEEIDATFTEARRSLAQLRGRIDPVAGSAEATLEDLRGVIGRLDQTVTDVSRVLEPSSPVRLQVLSVLEEIERAARSTRVLADQIKQQPDAIIFGRGGGG